MVFPTREKPCRSGCTKKIFFVMEQICVRMVYIIKTTQHGCQITPGNFNGVFYKSMSPFRRFPSSSESLGSVMGLGIFFGAEGLES